MVPVKIYYKSRQSFLQITRAVFRFAFLITTKFLQIETAIKNYGNLYTNYDRTIIIIIIIIIINYMW